MKNFFVLLSFLLFSSQIFSRPDLTWSSPPTTLSSLGVNASNPLTVVDTSGNTTVAWIESGLLKASTLPFGGSWSAATTVSGSTASSPVLRMDGSGNAFVAWAENGVIKMASLPSGGSWSAATTVSSSGASSPALAVDATGNVILVWVRNGFIETSTQLFGGLLNLVQMLSSNGTESNPDVYIGSGGKVVAVWGSVLNGNNIFYSSNKLLTGSWSTSAAIISSVTSLQYAFPKVVVDQNGNATASGYRYKVSGSAYNNVQVLAATLPSGAATWGSLTTLSNIGLVNPANLTSRLKINSNGNVLAFWTNSYDGDTFAVETAVLPFGGSWSPGGLLAAQNLYAFEADAATTSAGNAVVTYMYFDGTSSIIQSTEADIGGVVLNVWSIPTNLSMGADNGYTKVATSLSNSTIYGAAVWINNNGANNVIQASTGTSTAVLPPTNLSVTQNSASFGVFTDYYNTISWTASTSPNLSQYLLYRNGTFFKALDSSITQFVDHNAVQNGSITYGVVVQDFDYSISAMATKSFP